MPTTQAGSLTVPVNYPSQYSHSYPAVSLQAQVPHTTSRLGPEGLPSYSSTNPPRPSTLAAEAGKFSGSAAEGVSTTDADLLLGLNASYSQPGSRVSRNPPATYAQNLEPPNVGVSSSYHYAPSSGHGGTDQTPTNHNANDHLSPGASTQIGDMMIETQDIDMNALQNQDAFPFSFNGELLPWLEYLPQDVLNYFGDHQSYNSMMSPQDNPNTTSQHP